MLVVENGEGVPPTDWVLVAWASTSVIWAFAGKASSQRAPRRKLGNFIENEMSNYDAQKKGASLMADTLILHNE
jgi:hypothetical protein